MGYHLASVMIVRGLMFSHRNAKSFLKHLVRGKSDKEETSCISLSVLFCTGPLKHYCVRRKFAGCYWPYNPSHNRSLRNVIIVSFVNQYPIPIGYSFLSIYCSSLQGINNKSPSCPCGPVSSTLRQHMAP